MLEWGIREGKKRKEQALLIRHLQTSPLITPTIVWTMLWFVFSINQQAEHDSDLMPRNRQNHSGCLANATAVTSAARIQNIKKGDKRHMKYWCSLQQHLLCAVYEIFRDACRQRETRGGLSWTWVLHILQYMCWAVEQSVNRASGVGEDEEGGALKILLWH